ncbi:MAG: DUF4417 domain-containing protein [Phascolarctobacterium sp.]|nr:DUF4417 domain-containing protein [Phascolarctobacterium sp.]
MTSKEMRENPLFMRNNFNSVGKWGFALNKKQNIDLNNIQLIASSNIKTNDTEENKQKGVHHYVDDYRFNSLYDHPEKSLKRYSQYKFLILPEYSTFADMDLWRQIESTGKNRWVGAYWQSHGLLVVPAICWSTPRSYEFCFDAVERGSVVAVGMIECKKQKKLFLYGYDAMLERINPSAIIILGSPFTEMRGNIIPVKYSYNGGNC